MSGKQKSHDPQQEPKGKKIPLWAYLLVGAAGFGILLFDVQSWLGPRQSPEIVATVNGQNIRMQTLQEATTYLASRNPELDIQALRGDALEQLIDETLEQQTALNSQYQISEQSLYELIKNQFDNAEEYQRMLNANNITPRRYQESMRQSLTIDNYYRMLTIASQVQQENNPLAEQIAIQRDLQLIYLPLEAFLANTAPSDEILRDYYNTHQERYLSPNKVEVSLLVLSPEKISAQQNISEETLQNAREKLSAQATRAGQYLIFDRPEDAEQAQKALENGDQNFDAIKASIEENTISGQTGDLLPNKKGDGILPEIDQALFALQNINDTSAVIQTEYGAMIIKLTAINDPSLNIDENQLRQEILHAQQNNHYNELANRLFDATQNGANIYELAELVGLSPETLEISDEDTQPEWLQDARIQALLFSENALEIGPQVEPIDLNGESLFISINDRQLPAPLSFEEAYVNIHDDYLIEQAQSAQEQLATQLIENWQTNNLSISDNIQIETLNGLSYLSDNIDADLARLLLSQEEKIAQHKLPNQSIIIARIMRIYPATEAPSSEFMSIINAQQQQLETLEQRTQMRQILRQGSKIRVNNDALAETNN